MTTFEALKPPAPANPAALRVYPLGGLGEVGRNMTVFETQGQLLIVDCGVLFPEEDQPGVDLILPDFGPIADRLDDVQALVLTHGHEDRKRQDSVRYNPVNLVRNSHSLTILL